MEQRYWELIAKSLSGDLSAEEELQFTAWIKASPDNEAVYTQVQKFWSVSSQLDIDYSPDTSASWEKLKAKVESGSANGTLSYRRNWLTIAATLLVVAVLGFVITYVLSDSPQQSEDLQYVEVSTADSVNIFYLPDSSKVFLNKSSSITYADGFNDTVRATYLIGEAYFEVQKNGKAFTVFAGGTQVTVLGTSFNVKANEEDERVEITVVEGRIAFREQGMPNDSNLVLQPNDQLVFNKSTKEHRVGQSANTNFWWRKIDVEDIVKKVINKVKQGIK